ncbi:MAG: hypothetical protein LBF62_09695 [Tannerellaceae bacterium]|jgi:hypothetical protein|nr:hypothetical protein [Tannerellaceae bacterium]
MKAIYTSVLCLLAIVFISSCTDKYTEDIRVNVPVYMPYGELRSGVTKAAPRELVKPGKIYFKGSYLLVVEHFEGIHFIDVSNPARPQNKTFVEVPGCVDIAMKDDLLYADSYVDLVILDVSDINNIREAGRENNLLPYTLPPAENDRLPYGKVDEDKGVVIGWQEGREKRELETVYYPYYPEYVMEDNLWSSGVVSPGVGTGGGSTGKSGSMARFGIYDKYLYLVSGNNQLHTLNISNPAKPVQEGWIPFYGAQYETMFIHDKHIFLGTQGGMVVYSLKVPSVPQLTGQYSHITSCDPVVVQDSIAYVTLRGGTLCNGGVNRLDVVKMTNDYSAYELVASYGMGNPYGLGIDGNVLFVCDGKDGLRIFDATDYTAITDNPLAHFPEIRTYDVIPVNGYLFMIGDDGFYLYDYSDIKNIRLIGQIPVAKN